MRQAVVRLGLGPGMEVYRSGKDWPAKVNNWNQVCNGGLGMGDLNEAYAGKASKVLRTCTFEERKRLTIADQVTAEVWWFAHTEAAVGLDASGHRATLTRNGKGFTAEISGPSDAGFEVRDAAPLPTSPDPKPQAENAGRRKLAIKLKAVKNVDLTVRLYSV